MPILAAEPSLFPGHLFNDPPPPEAAGREWCVLHARPRQEKRLARYLNERRTPFYLPLVPRRCQTRGRVMTSHVPLFAGYVLYLGDRDECLAALSQKRTVGALRVIDQGALGHDLRQTHRLIVSGAPVTAEERLAPGMTVKIQSEALAGLKGEIVRSASGRRFVVRVDFIQQGASVLMTSPWPRSVPKSRG